MNSCFTLSLVTGQSVTDLTLNAVANLGWDEVRLPHPLFEGDTVYSRSEVLETRESKSRPKSASSASGRPASTRTAPVIEFTRTFMIWKRGHVPKAASRRQLDGLLFTGSLNFHRRAETTSRASGPVIAAVAPKHRADRDDHSKQHGLNRARGMHEHAS